MYRILLFFGCLCLLSQVKAQNVYGDDMGLLSEVVTEIASRSEEDVEEVGNMLYRLANNPIAINSATSEDLECLFWLSEFQIQNIRKYLLDHGPVSTKYELVYIPGISEEDARLMAPFLSFEMPESNKMLRLSRLVSDSHNRLILRSYSVIEKQKGYFVPDKPSASNYFVGSPISCYLRYAYQYDKRIMAGFTAEKDAGEDFFKGSNKHGFDFYSFHVQINKIKFIKTLVLGDYQANFGQGLAVWSGVCFGKSPVVMGSMQRSCGISSYQSTDENKFFRGAAMTVALKPIEVSAWYSSHRIDANSTMIDSTTNEATQVSSLLTSGIHATPGDIADKDAIRVDVMGGNFSYMNSNLRIGTTAIYYRYSAYINPESQPYNLFYFRGQSNCNLSLDYRYRIGNIIFIGEEAICREGGVALLNGFQSMVNSRLCFNLINRYYQRNYQAMFGNAFGENSRINNESGLYFGVELKPLKYISLSGYIDMFRFPWLSYGIDMPSSGHDFLVQLGIVPSNRFQINLQYRNKKKDDNFSIVGTAKSSIVSVVSDRLRCQSSYMVLDELVWHSRLEFSNFDNEGSGKSRGYYSGEELEFRFHKLPMRLYFHYGMFDTDDYNSRVYAYESDLLYTFSVPVLFGKGTRSFVMARYSPSKNIDFWLKYSLSQYSGQETVGSGLYEIQGNKRSDIKVQLLVKF